MAEDIVDAARLEAAQQFIQEEEGPRRQLIGSVAKLTSCAAVAMSLVHLYWAWATVIAQVLRLVFLGFSLVLTFLIYPARRSPRRAAVPWYDWLLILASLAAVGYPLWDFEEFIYRAAIPTRIDQIFGALTILLVLEATRRTTGSILPMVAIGFLAYAVFGAYLPSPWTHQGYGIVIFMLGGYTAILSVAYATVLAVLLSFIRSDTALTPTRLWQTLEKGATDVLSVAATCAAAGIIVGVVTLTGLGLKFSLIILALAGNSLFLTVLYTAFTVWVLGLAVPVTASYIIAAVITAPAMIKLGVPEFAAHMFIFYYAVLSEVSPPTALSPFAAAAITGGNPYKTTMMAWKYTLPAFLVPFIFTLSPDGVGLLLKGSWTNIIWTGTTAMVGLGALAAGLTGWLRRKTTPLEQALLLAAGLVLVFPGWIKDLIGLCLFFGAVVLQTRGKKFS